MPLPRRIRQGDVTLSRPRSHLGATSGLESLWVERLSRYRHRCFFVGSDVRALVHTGQAEYVPTAVWASHGSTSAAALALVGRTRFTAASHRVEQFTAAWRARLRVAIVVATLTNCNTWRSQDE